MLQTVARGTLARGLLSSRVLSAGFRSSAVMMHGNKDGEDCSKHADAMQRAVHEYASKLSVPEGEADPLKGSEMELEDILSNNKEWVEQMNLEDPTYFAKLGAKQDPRYLYIGCSDARVDPNRLMGLTGGGKMFIHRNIGNVVSGTDLNLLSVVDFAVNFLKVPHILVVGHYDCGAVRGSIGKPTDGGLGIVENWLRNIRDVARFHREKLMAINDQEERVRKLVELNVQEQCLNVMKIGTVQRARINAKIKYGHMLPRVHGLVFDPANGILQKLPLDFAKLTAEDRDLYELYRMPEWLEAGKKD